MRSNHEHPAVAAYQRSSTSPPPKQSSRKTRQAELEALIERGQQANPQRADGAANHAKATPRRPSTPASAAGTGPPGQAEWSERHASLTGQTPVAVDDWQAARAPAQAARSHRQPRPWPASPTRMQAAEQGEQASSMSGHARLRTDTRSQSLLRPPAISWNWPARRWPPAATPPRRQRQAELDNAAARSWSRNRLDTRQQTRRQRWPTPASSLPTEPARLAAGTRRRMAGVASKRSNAASELAAESSAASRTRCEAADTQTLPSG